MTAGLFIRLACAEDVPAIAAIYDAIHTREEQGLTTTGWVRSIYPTQSTALAAVQQSDMYVALENGRIVAAARINREQVPEYAQAAWLYPAREDQVMVLHTLVVDPAHKGRGIGSRFVRYYEEFARAQGCSCLRMDTNARNTAARRLYKALGYREAGVVPCCFNGIGGVQLVCLEKLI